MNRQNRAKSKKTIRTSRARSISSTSTRSASSSLSNLAVTRHVSSQTRASGTFSRAYSSNLRPSKGVSSMASRKSLARFTSAERQELPSFNLSTRKLSTEIPKTVGVIGLGNMGGHMAHNLIKKGHDLVIYDIMPENIQRVQSYGTAAQRSVTLAANPQEVALKADVVVTMLPSSPHVLETYQGPQGIMSSFAKRAEMKMPKLLLIDSSTIAPPVSKQLNQEVASHQFQVADMVDAPVSGGVGGAEQGTLTFMVGGSREAFDMSKPFLEKMGKNIIHCGEAATGQAAKVCNNLILGITMAGISEAYNLGIELGLDPKVMAGIVNTSSGRCWSSDTYNPVPGVMPTVPASNNYNGGFGSALMLKDMRLALEAAGKVGAKLQLGELSTKLYDEIDQSGNGKKDFAYVFQHIRAQNQKH